MVRGYCSHYGEARKLIKVPECVHTRLVELKNGDFKSSYSWTETPLHEVIEKLMDHWEKTKDKVEVEP